MDKEVKITLTNTQGNEFPLLLIAEDNRLGKKWVVQLQRLLQQTFLLEKNFCFLGFPRKERDFLAIAKEVQGVLREISSYRKAGIWETGFSITEEEITGDLSQQDLNRLHHYFEQLMGQAWNLSEYYLSAEKRIRKSTRDLNFLVHEYEFLKTSFEKQKRSGLYHALTIVSFLHDGGTNIPIEKADLPYFTLSNSFGSVKAHYAQTGKNHYDAWRDGDQEIFGNNISGLRALSGEFVINWLNSQETPKEKMFSVFRDFYSWLEQMGCEVLDPSFIIGPDGKWEGIGFPRLAITDLASFGTTEPKEIQKILSEFANIKRIEVARRKYEFPYSADGAEFQQMVIDRV